MVSINGNGNVHNNLFVNVPTAKETVQKQPETVPVGQDNKFIKEADDELLRVSPASAYGVNIVQKDAAKIDKEFWGDTIDGLNLSNLPVAQKTVEGVKSLDRGFDMMRIQGQIDQSPFMATLANIFGIA